MAEAEHLSDDYVASLLAKDAKRSNVKYSAYGLQELLPRRSTLNASKPNTRFLKNIIRETDSHNAALRAKENQESKARLQELRRNERSSSSLSARERRLDSSDYHRSKRRRVDSEDRREDELWHAHGKTAAGHERDQGPRGYRKGRGYSEDRYQNEDARELSRQLSHRHRQRHIQRENGISQDDERSVRNRWRDKSRHRSRSRAPQRARKRSYHHHRSPGRTRSPSSISQESDSNCHVDTKEQRSLAIPSPPITGTENDRKRASPPASDSDPLDAIIGPKPPPPPPKVRSRGRGAFGSSSAMDSRFSSNYDPSIDVQPDPDIDDDWDQALEALRDRQRWMKQGAERLKSAGFTEEEVQKWETGGEKKEADVKWAGRGEGREWDRGKVVGEEGVETRPEWGRLKGT